MTLSNQSDKKIDIYGYQVPKKSQVICGDRYFWIDTKDYFLCVLSDGLGSGEAAYMASSAVIREIEQSHDEDVQTLMEKCNKALKSTRGAAVAIIKVYYKSREFVYSCVGNLNFYLFYPSDKLIYPLPVMGYLSGKPQRFNTQRYSYVPNSKFLFHSDGVEPRSIKSLLRTSMSLDELVVRVRQNEHLRTDDFTFIAGFLS
ncbi:PP2C family serine/threonine-protein phosphatase [Litchfieldia salsa]|uniref:Negative regulator of sigma-B (Phosphoserine phosphatase) n=1 Tax=Litchfieldia salsa TaxID=930152 RepID=A0A1H0WY34_9BACI|nr:PP2C family serine/threonine-protein phosphatase [Litchfieldia salsa]SDP95499.1 negative regulator of sigma-B (phosphoserine phosphatase) [Litchfieldia salsa]